MKRKTKTFYQQEKESEDFLKKLNSITKQRKKDSSQTYHKFELIKHLQLLNIHQKKLEEELNSFLTEKNLKSIQSESESFSSDRLQYRKSLYVQIDGFTQLVKDFKNSLPLFQSIIIQGNKSEAFAQWNSRKEAIQGILLEIKQDLTEREEFLLNDYNEELEEFEEVEKEDLFLSNLSSEIPGLSVSQVREEYIKAKDKVNELFQLKLSSIVDPKHEWDEESHLKFIYIYKQYIEKALPRERYMERLILEFPSLSRQELERHDKIVESLRWNNKHRKNFKIDWDNHLSALQKAAEDLLEKQMDEAIERFNKELLFVQQEKLQNRLSAEYQEKRSEFLLRLEAKEKSKSEEEEKRAAEEQKKEKERNERAKESKKIAGEYKDTKSRQNEAEKARREKEALEKTRKTKESLKLNKGKIEYRQNIEQQKLLEKKEEVELENLKKEEEKRRIEEAISGYSHIPKVQIDKERVKQSTKSKDAKKNEYDLGDKAVIFKQTGFTVDNLMKDMRYKLSHLLNEAGLANTEYAKKVIQNVPHQNPRKDTISSHFK